MLRVVRISIRKIKLLLCLAFFFLFLETELAAQFVYLEDFTLPSGTIVDNGDSPWTRDISNANLGGVGDRFEVRDNNGAGLLIFEASDTDGEAVWLSGIIDISNLSTATISVDVAEAGNMENNDYLRISYILDGGPEVRFGNLINDFGATFQTISSAALTGSTVQVIVRVRNNNNNELHAFDNVAVTGPASGNVLFARQSGDWNSLNSWSFDGPNGATCSCFPDENSTAIINNNNSINITAFSEVNDLTIQNTGSLIWAADTELNVFNNGTLNIQSGGLLDMTGFDFSQLDIAESAGDFRLIVDGTLIANDIDLNGSDAILDISGSGVINVLKDLRFDFDRITLNNSFDGQFTLQGDILLGANNSVINNGGKMEVAGDILFDNPFAGVANQIINNSDSLIVNDIFVLETTSVINNLSGGFINYRNIDVATGFDLNFDNLGVAEMDGDFSNTTTASQFINRSGAEWRYEGTVQPTDLVLITDEVNNTFVYQGANQQILDVQGDYYNLVIANTGSKTANTGLTILGDLSIQGVAQLDLETNAADIFISGDFSNTSTNTNALLSTNRTITFNGGTTQQVNAQGAQFSNINLNKTGGDLDITSRLNLNAALRFNSVTNVESNGNLRLVSTTDNNDLDNGRILSIPNGASVNGDVIVERFISGEGNIWRYVGSPIQNATVADWQDDVSITGRFSDPSNGPGVIRTNVASLYFYDEAPSGSLLTGWTRYPTSGAAADNALEVGVGYALFIYDGANPKTLDLVGPVNQGTIDLDVSYNSSGDILEDGWNLVSNPYPSTIDWDAPGGWVRSGLANATYIRDNSLGGVFATYIDGLGLNNGTSRIASGQAFWVKAESPNPQLQINEQAKLDEGRTFFEIPEIKKYLRLSLSDSASSKDETIIRFKSRADIGFNSSEDAPKRSNATFNLASYSADSMVMAINALPEVQCDQNIDLFIQYLEPKEYTLSLDELINIDTELKIYLIDRYTQQTVDLIAQNSYTFTVNSDTASFEAKRFALSFDRETVFDYPISQINLCEGEEILLPAVAGFDNYQVLINGDTAGYNLLSGEILLEKIQIQQGDIITLIADSQICGAAHSVNLPVSVYERPEIFMVEVNTACDRSAAAFTVDANSVIEYFEVYQTPVEGDVIYTSDSVNFSLQEENWQDTYYVIAYNKQGCESARFSVDVEFSDLLPVITQLNDTTLQANYSENIQWYKDGELIDGATSQELIVNESGTYELAVWQQECFESVDISIDIAADVEENTEEEIVTNLDEIIDLPENSMVFPNPTARYLSVPLSYLEPIVVTIFDAKGVVIYTQQQLNRGVDTITIDLADIPGGLYVIKIIGAKGESTQQFIKQ